MIEMCAECHLLCFFLTSRLLLAGVIRVVLPGGLGLWDQTQVEDVSSHAAGQGKWNLFAFSAVCYMLPICSVKPVRKLVIYENIYIYIIETNQIEARTSAATSEWFLCPWRRQALCWDARSAAGTVLCGVKSVLVLHGMCKKQEVLEVSFIPFFFLTERVPRGKKEPTHGMLECGKT